ncbi:hypothetical protein EX895_006389 [Sporisorium graminicola]|uniref:MaoC-like domain-containing protein n=1 Tax=Sporisorium graminicola TaxID=280036 RepID=A0A4U7KN81_9BASI|nr:hypothetical protein EX895_006389 [Sporisorium graminicola]TKY84488.1 hypothetical protein EX895_006389 [Sporisorium graminicola]
MPFTSISRLLPQDTSPGLAQLGLGLVLSVSVYQLSHFHLRSLCRYFFASPPPGPRGTKVCKLDFAPSDIGWADRSFLLLFGVLYKAVRRRVVGTGLKLAKGAETVELPRLELMCPIDIGDGHKELYGRAVAQSEETEVGTDQGGNGMERQFLLAAMTNQLMLLLVVHPKLPVSPLGGVNVRNRIESHSPLPVPTGPLTAHAYVGGKDDAARVVKRGIEFDIHIDIHDSHHLILRQTITILTLCKTHITSSNSTPQAAPAARQFDTIGRIHMTTSSPSLWCRVCGDYNPIHVSATLARLFGFRGKIAHGNHVVAKLLHLYACQQSGGGLVGVEKEEGWWIEMQFKRPMVLPLRMSAQLEQGAGRQSRQWQCVAEEHGKEDKVYVLGSLGRS